MISADVIVKKSICYDVHSKRKLKTNKVIRFNFCGYATSSS